MAYLGAWQIDDLLTFTVTTHTFATGALTDADAMPSYRIYEDETGTAILTGSMAKLDDANTTGHYSEQIALSAANGFENGKSYSIYITAAVAGVTGGTVRNFQVELSPAVPGSAMTLAADAISASALSAAAIDEIIDEVIEGTLTLRQVLRILLAEAVGKAAGGGTTSITFRDQADTKNRIAATVDASGNRSAVTLDAS